MEHWITRRCEDIDINRAQLSMVADVGEVIIGILTQGERWSVTHPKIAGRIADILCATDAEWDSIVPEIYRGQRKQYSDPKRRRRGKALAERQINAMRASSTTAAKNAPRPRHIPKRIGKHNSIRVIDRAGNVVGGYNALLDAQVAMGISRVSIVMRCDGKLDGGTDEFKLCRGLSFRWAEPDDVLTLPELPEDFAPDRSNSMRKCVIVIDRDGRELDRCASIGDAAIQYDVSMDFVRKRCNGKAKGDEFAMLGVSFRVEGGAE